MPPAIVTVAPRVRSLMLLLAFVATANSEAADELVAAKALVRFVTPTSENFLPFSAAVRVLYNEYFSSSASRCFSWRTLADRRPMLIVVLACMTLLTVSFHLDPFRARIGAAHYEMRRSGRLLRR